MAQAVSLGSAAGGVTDSAACPAGDVLAPSVATGSVSSRGLDDGSAASRRPEARVQARRRARRCCVAPGAVVHHHEAGFLAESRSRRSRRRACGPWCCARPDEQLVGVAAPRQLGSVTPAAVVAPPSVGRTQAAPGLAGRRAGYERSGGFGSSFLVGDAPRCVGLRRRSFAGCISSIWRTRGCS